MASTEGKPFTEEEYPGETPGGRAWFSFSLGESVHMIDSGDAFEAGWNAAIEWAKTEA